MAPDTREQTEVSVVDERRDLIALASKGRPLASFEAVQLLRLELAPVDTSKEVNS